jgi:hypothetical protein
MGEKIERKFRTNLTIGIIKDLDMTMGELAKLTDLSSMKMPALIQLINAMIVEGPKIDDDTDLEVLKDVLPKIGASLMHSRPETTIKPNKPILTKP